MKNSHMFIPVIERGIAKWTDKTIVHYFLILFPDAVFKKILSMYVINFVSLSNYQNQRNEY